MVDKLTNAESYRTVTVLDEALECLRLLSVLEDSDHLTPEQKKTLSQHEVICAMQDSENTYLRELEHRGGERRPEGKREDLDVVIERYRHRVRDVCRLLRQSEQPGDSRKASRSRTISGESTGWSRDEGKSEGKYDNGNGGDAAFSRARRRLQMEAVAGRRDTQMNTFGGMGAYGIRSILANLEVLKATTVEDFSTTVEQHEFNVAHLVEVSRMPGTINGIH